MVRMNGGYGLPGPFTLLFRFNELVLQDRRLQPFSSLVAEESMRERPGGGIKLLTISDR